tara:strand:+ start:381 stop:1430 length:1050 start_codon:yes stop_codon:yes gene_type:complete
MSISDDFLAQYSINRSFRDSGGVYLWSAEEGYRQVNDEATLALELKKTGTRAISKYLYDNETYNTNAAGTELSSSEASKTPADERTIDEGLARARALFKFFPESVKKEFAKNWVIYGETALARSATRQTSAWRNEFEYLERDDGSLIMSEMDAIATKATYRQTLAEVGIIDTTEFEKQFEGMIKGEVSGAEFQQRIDLVHSLVKDNIPGVEKMFREQYGIETDSATIFGALINPQIQDKMLKGDLQTIGIAAEAGAAGFTGTFARFDSLRKAGLTQEKARETYQAAGTYQTMAQQTGREFSIETLESAAIGDVEATKELGLLAGEQKGLSSIRAGAAKKDGKTTGLLEY